MTISDRAVEGPPPSGANARAPGRAEPGVPPTLLIVGNPNVGKTSLFNRLARRNERVGNYPGVTVERRSADLRMPSGKTVTLADLPGAYSLSARSSEEQIALQAVLGWNGNPLPDLVIVVVDAGQLLRNLYLVLQLLELRVPVVVALNMVDEAGERTPSAQALSRAFGVPFVPTNARSGSGTLELQAAIERQLGAAQQPLVHVAYPPALRQDMDRVASALPESWRGSVERDRALALWALSSLEPDDELNGIPDLLRQRTEEVLAASAPRDIDREIIESRYHCLEAKLAEITPSAAALRPHDAREDAPSLTERIDRVLLHPAYGFFAFIAIMLVIFQSIFAWADPAMGVIEAGFASVHEAAAEHLPAGFLRDLLTSGIIDGVGNVLVFLPQILLLFLFIGLLEDSGYMARVAYLMDRALRSVGLHGRAFVPMMSGFACAVPAIMATRTMERRRDRLLTMLVVPLMSCSARLPVYTLIIGALFPPSAVFGVVPVQGLLMVSIYLFSTIIALVAAAVLGRTLVRGRSVPLILELPPYRFPGVRSVLAMMWMRAAAFLREAGSVILAFTIVMWLLLSFPKVEPVGADSAPSSAQIESADAESRAAAQQLEQSFGGRLGKALEPVIEPLGFDWKIGIGIVGAFAAREVFVSTLGLVYGLGEVGDDDAPLRDRMRAEMRADGRPVYTPLVGLSLMVFFALACQCMSTLAIVRRETRSWRWPVFLFAYMTGLAWVASFIVFQGGRALGF